MGLMYFALCVLRGGAGSILRALQLQGSRIASLLRNQGPPAPGFSVTGLPDCVAVAQSAMAFVSLLRNLGWQRASPFCACLGEGPQPKIPSWSEGI